MIYNRKDYRAHQKRQELNYGRETIKEFLSGVKLQEKSNILDLGVGNGEDFLNLKEFLYNSNLFGTDFDLSNKEYLEKKNIIIKKNNIEDEPLPFNDSFFDIIIANQILEHCKQIFWFFHEVSRVLKINSFLIIGFPNLASFHSRIMLLLGYQPSCINLAGPHIRGITKKGFISFLDTFAPNLYKVKRFSGSNFYPFPNDIAKILARLFPNNSVSIFFLLQKQTEYDDQFIKINDSFIKKDLSFTDFKFTK